MLPGRDITAESADLVGEFRRRRNPAGLAPIDLLRSSTRVTKDALRGPPFDRHDTFLVLFEHPVLERRTRLVTVPRDELLAFADAEILPERGEGRDMTIAPPDLSAFLVCNHDGDTFLLNPPIVGGVAPDSGPPG
jgi:hypothetical protein